MSLYILVEGKETEPVVYKKWLLHLLPDFSETKGYEDAANKNFLIVAAAKKTPSFPDRLRNSIREINENPNFSHFLVCFDTEELSVIDKILEISEIFSQVQIEHDPLRYGIKICLITPKPCIETWFLGNMKIFKRIPTNLDLIRYVTHYNVYESDPELMKKIPPFNTDAQFHYDYLRKMVSERPRRSYSKDHPNIVGEKSYLEQLIVRIKKTNHLNTFRHFMGVIEAIREDFVEEQSHTV